jgi:hypothetical protein
LKINEDVLYVIKHDATKTVKIGITGNWDSRSKSLKIGEKTSLVALYNCPCIYNAEKELHNTFKEWRLPGSEYFNLKTSNLQKLVNQANQAYQNITDQYQELLALKQHDWLDITGAVSWSASDWFRLNQERWKNHIIEVAKSHLYFYGKEKKPDYNRFDQFEQEVYKFMSILKPSTDWGEGQGVHTTVAKMWCAILQNTAFAIKKKDFTPIKRYNGYDYKLHKDYDFKNIKIIYNDNQLPILKGREISENTVEILFEIMGCYRLLDFAGRAYDSFRDPTENWSYWQNFGPKKNNKSCVFLVKPDSDKIK